MTNSLNSSDFSRMGSEMRVPVIVDLMANALKNPELLSLAAGFTDNRVLPNQLVSQICQEITSSDAFSDALQYGQNQGRPELRRLAGIAIEEHPNEVAGRFDPERLFLCNGSQQALYLAAQTLCDRGDIILVEEPSYFVCLEMLKGLGVRAVGIPCDEDGAIRIDAFVERLAELEAAGERDRIRALYLVSYFSNPSSRSMGLDQKEALAEVLLNADMRIPVIEDAAYRDLFFEAPHPAPSIISLDVYEAFPRLYLGTFTKPFASGLKVGYGYCTDRLWLEKMLCIKGHQDFGSAHFNQCIIERLLSKAEYSEHMSKVRAHYSDKSERMHHALLDSGLKDLGWSWARPKGGLLYWLRGPAGIDTRMNGLFCERCIEQGVLYVPGDLCFPGGTNWRYVRLSFGAISEVLLPEAVARFAVAAKELE